MTINPPRYLVLFPALFVLIWSTGWIVGKYASPHAEPLSFLTLRFALAGALLALFCLVVKAKWPAWPVALHALFSGLFLHAIYLGGIWFVLDKGMPSTLSGLMAALQPLMTAVLAGILVRERLRPLQYVGLVLGFLGLVLALAPKLGADIQGLIGAGQSIGWGAMIALNFIAMASVTFGTVYQKRYLQEGDLRTITTLQYAGACFAIFPAAGLLESFSFAWNGPFFLAMAWSVFGLSFGAIGLLVVLIRYGEVSRAATLNYLVPPVIAVQAFFLFGEQLSPLALAGMTLTVFGVYLVSRKPIGKVSA